MNKLIVIISLLLNALVVSASESVQCNDLKLTCNNETISFKPIDQVSHLTLISEIKSSKCAAESWTEVRASDYSSNRTIQIVAGDEALVVNTEVSDRLGSKRDRIKTTFPWQLDKMFATTGVGCKVHY